MKKIKIIIIILVVALISALVKQSIKQENKQFYLKESTEDLLYLSELLERKNYESMKEQIKIKLDRNRASLEVSKSSVLIEHDFVDELILNIEKHNKK